MKTQEERYLEMRNANRYDINWFYEHYMDISKDKNMNIDKFNMIFQTSNFDSILDHLDDKFKLDKLYDTNGKVIAVYKNNNN
jgi:hypothetical protein